MGRKKKRHQSGGVVGHTAAMVPAWETMPEAQIPALLHSLQMAPPALIP